MTISPVDPENSTEILNQVAAKAVLFTVDGDAPKSNRVMYIGTDNVAAGRQCGELIKKALPNGGKIMLFVGTMDAANAQERSQGIKEAIAGTKVEIIDIRTDGGDQAKAKANVEDTLTKYPEHRPAVSGCGPTTRRRSTTPSRRPARKARSRSSASTRTSRRCKGVAEGVDRGDRRPAALRVRLPVDEATWRSTSRATSRWCRPNKLADHPDQGDRQVERGGVRREDPKELLKK